MAYNLLKGKKGGCTNRTHQYSCCLPHGYHRGTGREDQRDSDCR